MRGLSPLSRSLIQAMSAVSSNLAAIEQRIARACVAAGRDRGEILLVAVSKTFPASAIDLAVAAGVTDIGENRVQEFRDKAPLLTTSPRKHLIGNLQTNKANEAARLFDVVQSIDRVEIVERLARAAQRESKRLDVLIQVNVGGEQQKSGCEPVALDALAQAVSSTTALRLIGLMTVPPHETAEDARPYFRMLKELRDALLAAGHTGARHLSMGMTEDFEVAIAEGATMIRLGRAIFGER